MIRTPQTGLAGHRTAGSDPVPVVELMAATSPSDAISAAVAWMGSAGVGAIGWLQAPVGEGGVGYPLARGVSPGMVQPAIDEVVSASGWSSSVLGRRHLHNRLAELLGSPVLIVPCGEAVLAIVDPRPEDGSTIATVKEALELTLGRIREAEVARLRSEGLHMGLASTAHELKGPLMGARAAIELALEAGDADAARGWLVRAHDELARMTDNVEPLLRWAAGAEPLDLQRVELSCLVEEVVSSCQLELQTDAVEVFGEGELEVLADARHLRSALANLIRNAVAYSPAGSPVAVRVHVVDEVARIEVHDRGPGVDIEDRALIFGPFSRGRVGRGARSGRGLGLFISSRIVEAHGGSIWLSTDASGSTFGIDLDLAAPVSRQEVRASAS